MKGIIFDFDGVIVDSETPYVESLVNYLESLGVKASFEEVQHVVGQNIRSIAEEMIGNYGLPLTADEFAEGNMSFYDEKKVIASFEPMPGILSFLEKAKAKGIKMCVASSSSYDYLYAVIDKFKIRHHFAFVLSGHEMLRSKPDPYIYDLAAERMGLDKKDLVIIEDSRNGILAGKNAGITTIGFKGSKILQDTSHADLQVTDFEQIEL